MTEQEKEKLKIFYEDKANWRPPSLQTVANFMGWKSKISASNALKKIYGTSKPVPPKS